MRWALLAVTVSACADWETLGDEARCLQGASSCSDGGAGGGTAGGGGGTAGGTAGGGTAGGGTAGGGTAGGGSAGGNVCPSVPTGGLRCVIGNATDGGDVLWTRKLTLRTDAGLTLAAAGSVIYYTGMHVDGGPAEFSTATVGCGGPMNVMTRTNIDVMGAAVASAASATSGIAVVTDTAGTCWFRPPWFGGAGTALNCSSSTGMGHSFSNVAVSSDDVAFTIDVDSMSSRNFSRRFFPNSPAMPVDGGLLHECFGIRHPRDGLAPSATRPNEFAYALYTPQFCTTFPTNPATWVVFRHADGGAEAPVNIAGPSTSLAIERVEPAVMAAVATIGGTTTLHRVVDGGSPVTHTLNQPLQISNLLGDPQDTGRVWLAGTTLAAGSTSTCMNTATDPDLYVANLALDGGFERVWVWNQPGAQWLVGAALLPDQIVILGWCSDGGSSSICPGPFLMGLRRH